MTKKLLIFSAVSAFLISCGGNKAPEQKTRTFPMAEIPALIENEQGRIDYIAGHFWGPYFSSTFPTDSAHILGVSDAEMEKAVANYISLLELIPMDAARASVEDLFKKTESKQAEDTSSLFYLRFTELVSKYMYDPNSPLRNEDFYLPFVKGLAASAFTSDDLRVAYTHEAEMCALNPFGTQVPDFAYKDALGRKHRLYDIKADLTLLFFSNPGCSACKDIMDDLQQATEFDGWIAEGRLAIASIYIDQELDAWREYVPNYPDNWVVGYDCDFVIRQDLLYNVRAIPSLYLLDSDKRVILKDAPTDKTIEKIYLKIQHKQ